MMFETLDATAPALPDDQPRYLMGVGKPEDLVGGGRARHRPVRLRAADPLGAHRPGVHPARPAQPAQRAARRRPAAARSGLRLPGLPRLRRAYLHHLVRCGEILGAMLLTWHNLPTISI